MKKKIRKLQFQVTLPICATVRIKKPSQLFSVQQIEAAWQCLTKKYGWATNVRFDLQCNPTGEKAQALFIFVHMVLRKQSTTLKPSQGYI